MIKVTCSKDLYTYNAYHLAKAFFPDEAAKVFTDVSQDASVIFDIGGNVTAVPALNTKDEVDKSIYHALSSITGRTLPWGLLTGVRPVKPAMTKLKEGMSREEFISWYGENKLVSSEKAALAYDIAQKELCILDRINPAGSWSGTCSIYIGIPFCPSICSYCSFSLGTADRYADKLDAYAAALCREIEGTAKLCAGREIYSIYIGGGTPTSLSAPQLERLLICINRNFDISSLKEFCIEAGRPDSITEEKLEVMKRYGAGRICINPQTMQQATLEETGRLHSADDVYKAFYAAREAGFDNINMDLIAGLPGETAADMADTVKKVLDLCPESLTVHALSIKRRAQMESQSAPEGTVSEMIDTARKKARAAGMEPYYLYRQKSIAGNFENTGYAKPGKEGIYNILTMEEVQTIYGLGAGAETKFVLARAVPNPSRGGKSAKILRSANVKNVEEYIRNTDEMINRKRFEII